MKRFLHRQQSLWLIAVLFVQGVLGNIGIGTPFSDGRLHWNWGPPFWLLHARATNTVGLFGARFGVVSDTVVRDGKAVAAGFYQSHPQLIGPVVALWTRFVGYSEWSARLLALVLTMMTTVLLWLAVRKLFSLRIANTTVAFWAALPIIAIYGRKIDQELLVTFFLALTVFSFARARQRVGIPWLFFFALVGACLADWSGFVFAGCLAIAIFLFGKKHDHRFSIAASAAIVAGALLLFFQLAAQWTVTHAWVDLGTLYRFRAVAAAPSVGVWLHRQFFYLSDNFGVLAGAALPVLVWFFVRRKKGGAEQDTLALAILGAIAVGQVCYLVAVPQAAAVHGYFQYYFSVPLALLFAMLSEAVRSRYGALLGRACALAIFLFACTGTIGLWGQVRRMWYGDATDVLLLRQIAVYPEATVRVQALGGPPGWFDNPNIAYYTDRNISWAIPGELPFPDVYVVAKEWTDALVDRLRIAQSNPPPQPVVRMCSNHFCLVDTHGRKE